MFHSTHYNIVAQQKNSEKSRREANKYFKQTQHKFHFCQITKESLSVSTQIFFLSSPPSIRISAKHKADALRNIFTDDSISYFFFR